MDEIVRMSRLQISVIKSSRSSHGLLYEIEEAFLVNFDPFVLKDTRQKEQKPLG